MFQTFISLGNACPLASSMSKYGLRSCSSPFDWLITPDFSWVLYHIDTDFRNFLLRANLEAYDDDPKHFLEKPSGIRFLHDDESFRYEYDALKQKYTKRIHKFIELSESSVCYLRRICSTKDLHYIETHADYIQRVIHKHNSDSEVVFLYDDTLSIPDDFPFRFFKMNSKWSGAGRRELRSYFDNADDFLHFCGENYSCSSLIHNLSVDFKREEPYARLAERKYKTLSSLLTYDFRDTSIPDSVIIYGAGVIGIEFYQRIKNVTVVKYFIDAKKAGETFDSVKIIATDALTFEEGTKIIVTATHDFEAIRHVLCNTYRNEDIISLDDILDLNFN